VGSAVILALPVPALLNAFAVLVDRLPTRNVRALVIGLFVAI